MLAPVIRLADKYLIEGLRAALIKHVVSDWPCTPAAWYASEGEANAIRDTLKLDCASGGRFADHIPEPAAAIVFAREFGCTEILPAAFYQLCRIGIKEEFDNQYGPSHKRLARWGLLDVDNLRRYLHGREELRSHRDVIESEFDMGAPIAPECVPDWVRFDNMWSTEDERDRSAWPCYAFAEHILRTAWPVDGEYEPLDGLLRLLNYDSLPDVRKGYPRGFCEECHWGFGQLLVGQLETFWKMLPDFFQLAQP